MKVTRLSAPAPIEEGAVADIARTLKAKTKSATQKVTSVLNRDSGGKQSTASFSAKMVKNEFETLCNLAVSKANVEARSKHAQLSNQNVGDDSEDFAEALLDVLETHVGSLVTKYRKGEALVTITQPAVHAPRGLYSNVVDVFESSVFVNKYSDSLATFWLIWPISPARAEKGPYFTVTFDSELDQRIVSLQKLIDTGSRRIHPHKADGKKNVELTSSKNIEPVFNEPPPTTSPQDTVSRMKQLWDEWKAEGKPATRDLKVQVLQMYRDLGGKGPI